ncbi:MAG: CBS domain-containing protein [Nakamurella sp.]
MTRRVSTVTTSTRCVDAARMLVDGGFTAAPVVDADGRLVGIVSESDLLRYRLPDDPHRVDGLRRRTPPAVGLVVDAMTTPVESLTPGADIADAVRIMLAERIRCLPVVDGTGVVGIVTRRDLLRFAVESDHPALDVAVMRQLAAIGRPDRWDVTIADGDVDLGDYGADDDDRRAAARRASAVPGVQSVTTHQSYADPF